MAEDLAGKTIDRYEIKSLIEKGPLGAVYLAFDPKLDREVAVRVLDSDYSKPGKLRERLLLETRAAVRWKHPGIMRIYDFGEFGSQFYLVLEYLPGPTLRNHLSELRAKNQAVEFSESLRIVYRLAEALDFAHQRGMNHGNLHPGNVMLRAEPGDEPPFQPVLADLGIPKPEQAEVLPSLFPYQSPERARGAKSSQADDLYALGVMLYEMAVGEMPAAVLQGDQGLYNQVRAIPPRTVCPEMPAELEGVILKAIAESPDARYSSASALASAAADARHRIDPSSPPLDKEVASTLLGALEKSLEEPSQVGYTPTPTVAGEPAEQPGEGKAVLQILEPNHTIRSLLVKPGGMTIGRDPGNDVVIDHPRVSRFHARIDFDGKQHTITDLNSTNGTFLGKKKLEPDQTTPWSEEIHVRIGDTWINLGQAGATAPLESTISGLKRPDGSMIPAAMVKSSPGSHRVGVVFETPNLTATPGKKTNGIIRLINQSSEADQFRISMQGITKEWIQDLPALVSLAAREEKEIRYSIQPPKTPAARAGRHPLSLRVSSLIAPDQVVEQNGTLTVQAFSQFESEIQPKEIRGKETGQIKLQNNGNVPETFTLMLNDKGSGLVFEPPAAKITVQPGETGIAEFRATPKATRWVGKEQSFQFSAHISSASGQIQTHGGRYTSLGLIPMWAPPAVLSVCLVMACVGAIVFSQVPLPGSASRSATRTARVLSTQIGQVVSGTMGASTGTALALGNANQATRDAMTATAVWLTQDDDRDGLSNEKELEAHTLTDKYDTDEDLLSDGAEAAYGTDPTEKDTDQDGLSDGVEVARGLDPRSKDTDHDGIDDAVDPDPGQAPTLTPTPIPTITPAPSTTPLPTLTKTPGATPTSTQTLSPSITPSATPNPPSINGLNPSNATTGDPGFQLTVNGANFISGMVVRWNGSNRPTFFTSSNQLAVMISSGDIESSGTYQVSVINLGTNQTSANFNFNVNNPPPKLDSISPTSAPVGGNDFTLTLNGSKFIKASVVRVNGANRATFYSNGTTLTARITSADIATAKDLQITVFNPPPVGGTSASQTFSVLNPKPVIQEMEPMTTTAGSPDFTITITGTGFVNTSQIVFDNTKLNTSVNTSHNVLTALVPENLVKNPKKVDVKVENPQPGGGLSDPKQFEIKPPSNGNPPGGEGSIDQPALGLSVRRKTVWALGSILPFMVWIPQLRILRLFGAYRNGFTRNDF